VKATTEKNIQHPTPNCPHGTTGVSQSLGFQLPMAQARGNGFPDWMLDVLPFPPDVLPFSPFDVLFFAS
jgi:hypothetical protein